jgi:hypothetical protein
VAQGVGPEFKPQYCKKKKKEKENTQHIKGLAVTQVVQRLASKHEILSSNPSTAKKKREYQGAPLVYCMVSYLFACLFFGAGN